MIENPRLINTIHPQDEVSQYFDSNKMYWKLVSLFSLLFSLVASGCRDTSYFPEALPFEINSIPHVTTTIFLLDPL